ncbi:uncharacterized protein LOC135479866 [Liolophura sinensis]|uniref:uncharacterized protein LOC135479866 n=1 Tax=Liolophura sinensis TaxID=3198878 RepID=UPI0031594C78
MANRLPPENYLLNAFLLEIAEEITDGDLHKMKSLLKGPGGIGRGILERISNTMDFFDKLQTTGLVTGNDIVVLQALLWNIGKKDVYEKMVQFTDQYGDILHISSPNPEPAGMLARMKHWM